MRRLNLLLAIVLLLAAVVARVAEAEPKIGALPPRFTAADQDGRNVSLDELTGKIVVLEWFDPACEYTQRHAAANTMKTLAEKYKDKNVAWLGIDSTHDASATRAREWRRTGELPYPVLPDGNKTLANAFGIGTVPYAIIIDKDGHVAYVGGIDDDEDRTARPKEGRINYLDRALDELTAGKHVTMPQGKVYGCPLK
jgi:peroxiredoxin